MVTPIRDRANKNHTKAHNDFWASLEYFIDSQCQGINWRGTRQGRVTPKIYD